jgi:HlyD family secretion protein
MTANLTITVDSKNDVLAVPNAAFRFTPDSATASNGQGQGRRNNTIWILDEDAQPQAKTVHTGITDGTRTEITGDDIAEGMLVITADTSKKPAANANNAGQRQGGGLNFGMPGVGGFNGPRGGGR